MAEKPWYEKIQKKNPNFCLKDVIEYKFAEMLVLSEEIVAGKVKQIEDGIKLGMIKKENKEEAVKKVKEDTTKNTYDYSLPAISERLFKKNVKVGGNPVGMGFLTDLLEDPEPSLARLDSDQDRKELISFFSTDMGVSFSAMEQIILKKRITSPTDKIIAVAPKTVEKPTTAKPAATDSTEKTMFFVTNRSSYNHAIRFKRDAGGAIHIEIYPDTRNVPVEGGQVIHSRRAVELFAEDYASDSDDKDFKEEYDYHWTSVIL